MALGLGPRSRLPQANWAAWVIGRLHLGMADGEGQHEYAEQRHVNGARSGNEGRDQ